VFGNPASVLVGDFLYSRAFQMMVGVGSMRVMQVLADATNIIAEGEVLQLMNCQCRRRRVDAYLQVIRYKTAKLFEAAANWAPFSAVPPGIEKAMAVYGMHLGTAFQLIDDVLDYSGKEAETGKHLGDDLAEGKPTLPLIHVMQNGSPQQAALVREPSKTPAATVLPMCWRRGASSGALDAARGMASRPGWRKRRWRHCRIQSSKETLLQLADFCGATGF
jgi:octaprenyl-diphosphate synthase